VLDSVAYQTADLLDAMHADCPGMKASTVLRVDGGMVASDLAMQGLADILGAPVDRPRATEMTARGAAYLAGHAAGLCPDLGGLEQLWALDRRFTPQIVDDLRTTKLARWRDAVARTRSR
jgi:glycerol kinase